LSTQITRPNGNSEAKPIPQKTELVQILREVYVAVLTILVLSQSCKMIQIGTSTNLVEFYVTRS
jgi:hypothetical protein